jgi:hypothetical protein
MPRRSSARVRAAYQRRPQSDTYQIRGASTALRGAIVRLERRHLWPGAVQTAYRRWSQTVHHRPLRHGGWGGTRYVAADYACCDHCTPDVYRTDSREVLHAAIRLLPPRASHELQQLVRSLDEQLFARARRDPTIVTEGPWWF